MKTKVCTKCKTEKELSKDNFHWDSRLEKGKGGLMSICKVCRNTGKPAYAKIRRKLLLSLGIKKHIHQYVKHKERVLQYIKKPEVVKKRKVIYEKGVSELSDAYVAGCASRFFKISRKEIYAMPDMIPMYRAFIKMKRLTNFNN